MWHRTQRGEGLRERYFNKEKYAITTIVHVGSHFNALDKLTGLT